MSHSMRTGNEAYLAELAKRKKAAWRTHERLTTLPAYLLQRGTLTAVQGKHVCDQSDNDDVGVNATVTWPGVEGRCLMQRGLPWTSVTTTRSASPVLSAPGSARDMETILKILFPDNFENLIPRQFWKILFPDAGRRERHRSAGPTPCLPNLLFQTARTPGRRSHQDHFELFLLQVAVLDIESSQRTDRIVPSDGSGCPK